MSTMKACVNGCLLMTGSQGRRAVRNPRNLGSVSSPTCASTSYEVVEENL